MQTIQNALLDYARNNKYLSPLLKFSSAMAVIYPVYLIVSRLRHLTKQQSMPKLQARLSRAKAKTMLSAPNVVTSATRI